MGRNCAFYYFNMKTIFCLALFGTITNLVWGQNLFSSIGILDDTRKALMSLSSSGSISPPPTIARKPASTSRFIIRITRLGYYQLLIVFVARTHTMNDGISLAFEHNFLKISKITFTTRIETDCPYHLTQIPPAQTMKITQHIIRNNFFIASFPVRIKQLRLNFQTFTSSLCVRIDESRNNKASNAFNFLDHLISKLSV